MKKTKILSIITIIILFSSILAVIPVYAATSEEIEDSIALGLPWLALQQNPDGSWGISNDVAKTGLAVLKLIDHVKDVPDIDTWTDPGYVYHDEIVDGLNYLFSQGYYVDISVQTYGDPDTLANGKGIRFTGFDDYETSIALMALGATMTPAMIVTEPGPLNGLTYADVVQDIVDYLSYTQRESLWARGGWGYEEDLNWADNSVSGYASLGLGYAQAFGATIPQFVKDELTHWIGIIQSPAGYSYYKPPASGWPDPYGDELLRTGNLLYQMALVGMPVGDANVQSALTWIENNWDLSGNSYQRAFCLMKGLEAYGITDEITVGVSGDWFDELSTYIVTTQNPVGNWPSDPHDWPDPYVMTAAWALLTLERTVAIPEIFVYVDIKPGSWPNPFNKDAKGKFAVVISGTEDFDVTTIDPVTLSLYFNEIPEVGEGALPLRWTYEDVATPYPTPNPDNPEGHDEDGDGFMDLVIHFSRQEIPPLMTCEEPDKSYWKLYLTGSLMEEFGSTPFTGFDWIRIQMSKGKNK